MNPITIAIFITLILPASLMKMNDWYFNNIPITFFDFLYNWLYISAPFLILLILFLAGNFFQHSFEKMMIPAFVILSAMLALWYCWLWLFVGNDRSGALAWIFYIPVYAVVLLIIIIFSLYKTKA